MPFASPLGQMFALAIVCIVVLAVASDSFGGLSNVLGRKEGWEFQGTADLMAKSENADKHRTHIWKQCGAGLSMNKIMDTSKWEYLSKYKEEDARRVCSDAYAVMSKQADKAMPTNAKGCKSACDNETLKKTRPCANKAGNKCCMVDAATGKLTNCIAKADVDVTDPDVVNDFRQKLRDKLASCPRETKPKCEKNKSYAMCDMAKGWYCKNYGSGEARPAADPEPANATAYALASFLARDEGKCPKANKPTTCKAEETATCGDSGWECKKRGSKYAGRCWRYDANTGNSIDEGPVDVWWDGVAIKDAIKKRNEMPGSKLNEVYKKMKQSGAQAAASWACNKWTPNCAGTKCVANGGQPSKGAYWYARFADAAKSNLKVTVFSEDNFQGRSQEFGWTDPGMGGGKHVRNLRGEHIEQDAISSVKVPKGLKVTLFQNSGNEGYGESLTLTAGEYPRMSDFPFPGGGTWDQTVSAIRVELVT